MEIIPLPATMAFFILFSLLLLGPPNLVAARLETTNPLVELSSRDELARIAGYGEEKLSTVTIAGSVLCSPCSDVGKALAQPISGASVAVSCLTSKKASKSNWVLGSTDKYGEFLIDLPSHLHSIPDLDKRCCVKVTKVPKNSICYHSLTGKHSGLEQSSDDNDGIRTYTAKKLVLAPHPSHEEECTNSTNTT